MEATRNQQAISVTASFTVTVPPDKVIVDRAEYQRLKAAADQSEWWTMAEVVARYKKTPAWLKSQILEQPRYMKQLKRTCVMYAGDGGRDWLFEPQGFSNWMRLNFPAICQTVAGVA